MNDARRRAFRAIEETCPVVNDLMKKLDDKVQDLIGSATQDIKSEVTKPFREALIDAYEEVIRLEGEVEALEVERDELQGKLADLKSDYEMLENQVAE